MEHRSHVPQLNKWGDNNDVPYDVPKSKQEFTPSRDGEHLQLNEPGRTRRVSGGADHSVDRSPLHTRQQGRSTSHSYTPNSSSSTPGRAKARPSGRGGDPPVDRGSTVPKFGDWDENDPTSADNFTGIFKKVRDEKKDGGKPPMISTEPEFDYNQRRSGNTSDSWCACFGWFKK